MGEEREKEVRRLNRLVKKAVEYRQAQRDTEYINNEAHYEGLQWNLAELGADSPFIVKSDINHLKNAVDIRLGSLYASSYYGVLKPLSEKDIEIVDNLNTLYKNEWYRLKIDNIIENSVIKSGCIFDNGYIRLGFDPNKIVGGTGAKREGVITAEAVETANIYLDPSAESIDKCNYIVEKLKFTMDELERDHIEWYKKLKSEEIKGSASKDNDTGNIFTGRDYTTNQDNIIVINAVYEKYSTEIEVPVELDTETSIGIETLGMTEETPVEETVTPMTEKIRVNRVKISYIYDNVILEVNEDYPFEEFPIIAFQWDPIPQSPYGIPLLRGLTIPQKVANLIESSINNIAVHYTLPTWVISEDSGLDVDDVAELINAIGVVWKVNDITTAIKQLEPPKVNTDIIQMGQTFVAYIEKYAGVSSVYSGDIGTAGSTAEGTIEAITRATVIDNNPLKQIQDFVERLTRLLIKFMTRYYNGDTMYIRNDLDDGKYDFKQIVMDDSYEDINFDFDVDLGSRSRTDKNRQYNLMKDIYQLQNQYKDPNPIINVSDIVKAAQLDNYNEMNNRLKSRQRDVLESKLSAIVQLIEIGQTTTPNGQALIDSETLSEAMLDIMEDNPDTSLAEQIISEYNQYQEQFTQMKQLLSNNFNQMQQGVDNNQAM